MSYPIDVIFCDARAGTCGTSCACMQPGRISKWVWRSYFAIELPAGAAGDVVRCGPDRLFAERPVVAFEVDQRRPHRSTPQSCTRPSDDFMGPAGEGRLDRALEPRDRVVEDRSPARRRT